MANASKPILYVLLKDFNIKHSITSLAEKIGMSRPGMFKILRKLESQRLIILSPIRKGKTSTYIISLNWENPVMERHLALILAEHSSDNQRWVSNFSELESDVDFTLIYGSILNNPKVASDIDILNIVSGKRNFIEIEKKIIHIQKTQVRKIHSISFTPVELKAEIRKGNSALIEAITKGIVLFGHENLIRFMKGVNHE